MFWRREGSLFPQKRNMPVFDRLDITNKSGHNNDRDKVLNKVK